MHSVCIRVAEKSGFQLLEFNGEPDHVHLLIEHSPATTVSQLAAQVKGVTVECSGRNSDFRGRTFGVPATSPPVQEVRVLRP